MNTRRLVVWLVSGIVGLGSTIGVIAGFSTTLEKFSISSASLIFLSLGSLVFIWLDYFLKTDYLKN